MAKLLILESQTLKSMVEISIVLQQKKTIQDEGPKPGKPLTNKDPDAPRSSKLPKLWLFCHNLGNSP